MSDRYNQEIVDLKIFFAEQTAAFPPIEITDEQRRVGIDALPEAYRSLNLSAFNKWLTERNYELSYNQSCIAMFAALHEKRENYGTV